MGCKNKTSGDDYHFGPANAPNFPFFYSAPNLRKPSKEGMVGAHLCRVLIVRPMPRYVQEVQNPYLTDHIFKFLSNWLAFLLNDIQSQIVQTVLLKPLHV